MINLNLERVYTDDGTELSTAGVPTSLAGADQLAYDGRYVWVTCAGGVAIYEFWGEASDSEPLWEDLDELTYPRYDSGAKKKLRLITFMSLGSQLLRVTRHVSLSLRPDILSTTADGTVMVGAVSCELKTIRSDLRVIAETSTNSLGSLSPKWIQKIGSKMYVTSGSNFTKIFEFDIETQRPIRAITLPERITNVLEVANSNLCAASGKLWLVNTFYDDATLQKLYQFDPTLNTWAYSTIPVRPSSARTFIADAYNGHVYITNYNNVSISKFTYAGTFVQAIRTNALPTGLWTDQNRRIWVNSYAGMLTLVDYDDDQVHNDWSTDDAALSLVMDPNDSTKLWWCDGAKLVRHDLVTKTQIETDTESVFDGTIADGDLLSVQSTLASGAAFTVGDKPGTLPASLKVTSFVAAKYDEGESSVTVEKPDWVFAGTFPTGNAVSLLSTVPQVIGYAGGEKTMSPYLIMSFDNALAAVRLDTYLLYRKSYAELNGQAAVVAGTAAYFGES